MKKSFYVGCLNITMTIKESNRVIHRYMPISIFLKVAAKLGLNLHSVEQSSSTVFPSVNNVTKCYRITFKHKFLERKKFSEQINALMINDTIDKHFKIRACK